MFKFVKGRLFQNTLALLLPLLGLFFLICEVYDNSDLMKYINSDTLLPAHLFQFVLHHGFHLGHFQLPRVTSLFPDLAWFYLVQKITDSWRWAFFSTGFMQSLLFLVTGAGIAQQLYKTKWLQSFLILSFVTSLILFYEINLHEPLYHVRLLVEIVAHGGPFVLSVAAAWFVYKCYEDDNDLFTIALFFISGLAFISDRLTFFSFHLPALGALLFLALQKKSISSVVKPGSMIVISVGSAWYIDTLLRRQQDALRDWHLIGQKLLAFRAQFEPIMIFKWVLPILLVFLIPLFFAKIKNSARWQNLFKQESFQFYQIFSLLSFVLTFVVVVIFLFFDEGSLRYLYPLFWWPLIWLSVYLVLFLGEKRTFTLALIGQSCLVVGLACRYSGTPRIFTAKSPLVECLLRHRDEYNLGSGKADYWFARKTSAFSDWSLTVDQVSASGRAYYWGNDLDAYENYEGKKPYNFYIMKDLNGYKIYQKYGLPKKVLSCPESDVWIY